MHIGRLLSVLACLASPSVVFAADPRVRELSLNLVKSALQFIRLTGIEFA